MTFYNAIVLKKEDIVKDSQLRKAEYIHVVRTFPVTRGDTLEWKRKLRVVPKK